MATRLVFILVAALFVAGIFFAACPRTPPPPPVAVAEEDAGPPTPVMTKAERPEWPHAFLERAEIAPERRCAIGEKQACGSQIPTRGGRPVGPFMRCMHFADGSFRFNVADCNTPLVVRFDERPVTFTAADARFQVGVSERTEWVSSVTPWLALDRDGSGCIEGEHELFAGFSALAELDDNHDGLIDATDPVYRSLVLWADRDQDKRCDPSELSTLEAAGVTSLELVHVTPEVTAPGSREGETSLIHTRGVARARLVDVYLAPVAGVH